MINLLGILFSLNSSEINTTQCTIINNIYSYTTDESAFFHQIENAEQPTPKRPSSRALGAPDD